MKKSTLTSIVISNINTFKRLKIENVFAELDCENVSYTEKYVYEFLALLQKNSYIKMTHQLKKASVDSTIQLLKNIPESMSINELKDLWKGKRERVNEQNQSFFKFFCSFFTK